MKSTIDNRADAAYIRYSSHRQDGNTTVEVQLETVHRAIGGPCIDYIDKAKTGRAIAGRVHLLRLIDDVASGKIRRVWVYNWSRLGRSSETHAIVADLEELGVEAISVTEGADPLARGIGLVVAQDYSRKLSHNVSRALERRFQERTWTGGKPPYGFQVITGAEKKRRLAIHPEEAEIIKQVFNWYLHESIGSKAIADRLRKQNTPWSFTTVRGMLTNHALVGQVRFNRRAYKLNPQTGRRLYKWNNQYAPSAAMDVTNAQTNPSAAMDASGDFIITWASFGQDGSNDGIYAQRYNAAGLKQGTEFRINSYTPGKQAMSSVAMDADGDFVATWEGLGQAGGNFAIYARRYSVSQRPAITASPFVWQNAPQRIEFTFDQDVSASLSTADVVLRNLTTSTTIPSSSIVMSWNAATRTATFRFPTLSDGGSLPDGDYRATLAAAGVSNAAGTTIAVDYAVDFFVLAGDANHDRRVNLTDYNILAANFGQSLRNFTQGDFNYDSLVNLADYNILAGRFGTVLGPDEMNPAARASMLPIAHPSRFGTQSIAASEPYNGLRRQFRRRGGGMRNVNSSGVTVIKSAISTRFQRIGFGNDRYQMRVLTYPSPPRASPSSR